MLGGCNDWRQWLASMTVSIWKVTVGVNDLESYGINQRRQGGYEDLESIFEDVNVQHMSRYLPVDHVKTASSQYPPTSPNKVAIQPIGNRNGRRYYIEECNPEMVQTFIFNFWYGAKVLVLVIVITINNINTNVKLTTLR